MLFPTLIIDNFFRHPERVVDFSNNITYEKDKEYKWPGKRSKEIHEINQNFFIYFATKVLSVLYPMNYKQISFNLSLKFQKISSDYKNNGWVHLDYPKELTAIVYLSKHKNCGTSIYDYKGIFPAPVNEKNKMDMYKNVKNTKNNLCVEENNNNFEETININSKYNRLLLFDSSQLHAAHKFIDEDIKEDRLTLIGFFNLINGPFIKYPCVENSRL